MGATTALLTTIAGLGLQGVGMIQQGIAAREQGEAEARIAEYNAQLAERQAAEAEKAAAYEAGKQEKEGERLQARQRALYAKGGVQAIGTPLTVLEETEKELEMDRLMILREGKISSARARSQAQMARMRGEAAKKKGKSALIGSSLAAGGTVLTGLGKIG